MPEIEIRTNSRQRDVVLGHDLTEAERKEFEYLDWSVPDGNGWTRDFARYRGQLYDLGDTEGIPQFAPGWDQYVSDSFFSGVLFRYPREGEELDPDHIICATYYCR